MATSLYSLHKKLNLIKRIVITISIKAWVWTVQRIPYHGSTDELIAARSLPYQQMLNKRRYHGILWRQVRAGLYLMVTVDVWDPAAWPQAHQCYARLNGQLQAMSLTR
jgi:hypothetical protein